MDLKAPLFTSLPLLLFFLLLSFSLDTTGASPPVLDIDGHKLQTGVGYYVLPVFRGRGGGLTLGASRRGNCPLAVVQERLEVSNGLPVKFSPANAGSTVSLSTDLNVWFAAATICVQSTAWRLGNYDEAAKKYFIVSGGVLGNPGRETISNWFKIEKVERNYYKFVFCPTVCNTCKVICRDVGVYVDGATRRLALSDEPFRVMFKKA